jgi:hypothetical protein
VLDEQGDLIDGTVRQELRDSVSRLVALTLDSFAATASLDSSLGPPS